MPLDLGSLELYMGPTEVGGPDDLRGAIVDLINGAQDQLCIAVQELEDDAIARAIIAARQRGVRVRVILESDYLLVTRTPAPDPFAPGGSNEGNRRIFNALLRAQVDVKIDLNPDIFHQKFIVRDPGTSRAAVLGGSTNFTPTGVAENMNHVVILRSQRFANLYQTEFDDAWNGNFGERRARHREGPAFYRLSHLRVKALFAPEHAPELEIMKQMLNARQRVDFAMFTFSRSSGIDDAMSCILRGNIPIRGLMDRQQSNQTWAASHGLIASGATLRRPRPQQQSNIRKVHHKLAVIDEQVTIVGSFNFTGPANTTNDENIMILGDILETEAQAIAAQRQVAAYALQEINRVFDDPALSEPLH